MPDESQNAQNPAQKPPEGDFQKAEKYIQKLVELMDQDRVIVYHTDLSQFDPSALEEHYRIDLQEYQVEVSHSKQPNSGEDAFVLLFTNVQKIQDELAANGGECNKKIVLAYTKLNSNQFDHFKECALKQIEKIKKREEGARFDKALKPIDELLDSPEDSEEKPEADAAETKETGVENDDITPKISIKSDFSAFHQT